MSIKELGKQSLVYGVGHILARLVTFLLLPLYTHVFSQEEYGVISLAYAFMGITLILYRYGMDTALMKFAIQKSGADRTSYISTLITLQMGSSLIISGILYALRKTISVSLLGVDEPHWVALLAGILFLDAMWNLPVLILRTEEKPFPFIGFGLLNVGLSLGLNILFVLKYQWGVEGVLLANLCASGALFILTFPIVLKRINLGAINQPTLRVILKFGLPFFPAGILNMIMELADRYILVWLADTASVGLYSAGYKLGLLGLIVVTGFNMGWTPYFLKRGKQPGARNEFAHVATIFLGLLGFVIVVFNIWVPEIMRISLGGRTLIGPEFWEAQQVVGIILLAYFFFGAYVIQLPGVFIKELTNWVVGFRAVGAIVNVVLNIILIPIYGVEGAAWATVLAHLCMSISIWVRTRNAYPIPYNIYAWVFPLMFIGLSFLVSGNIAPRLLLTLAYVPMWFLLALNSEEKQIVRTLLQ